MNFYAAKYLRTPHIGLLFGAIWWQKNNNNNNNNVVPLHSLKSASVPIYTSQFVSVKVRKKM